MASPFQFSGSLEEIPLPDIARLFQSTRKTGGLHLSSGKSSGSVYFDCGEIVDCQSINMSGLDALNHIALFNRGSFEFADGATPASQTLNSHETKELIRFLEARMQECRQLQELMPTESEIPRYLGGALPSGLEVSAPDLAVALKASQGAYSVRHLAMELNLDEIAVCYAIARFRAAGLMEIVGEDQTVSESDGRQSTSFPTAHKNDSSPHSSDKVSSSQPLYWRGRKIQ